MSGIGYEMGRSTHGYCESAYGRPLSPSASTRLISECTRYREYAYGFRQGNLLLTICETGNKANRDTRLKGLVSGPDSFDVEVDQIRRSQLYPQRSLLQGSMLGLCRKVGTHRSTKRSVFDVGYEPHMYQITIREED